MVTDDAAITTMTPEALFSGGTGRAVLTRAELIDAGVRVVTGTGGRLAAGSAALLAALLRDVNAHLIATWSAPR